MKTVLALVLLGASQLCVATPIPEPGLLRTPRIYNALITTDAKLQPSRTSPYSVPAVPVIGPLDDFARVDTTHNNHHHHNGKKSHREEQQEEAADLPDVPAEDSDAKKMSSSRMYPETFYPQSVGYYPHPFIPYSYPLAPQPYPFGQYSSAGVGGGSYSAIGGPGFAAGGGIAAYSSYPAPGSQSGAGYSSYPAGSGSPVGPMGAGYSSYPAGSGSPVGPMGAGYSSYPAGPGSPVAPMGAGYSSYPAGPGSPVGPMGLPMGPSDFAIEQSSSLHMTSGRKQRPVKLVSTGGGEEEEDASVDEDEYYDERR